VTHCTYLFGTFGRGWLGGENVDIYYSRKHNIHAFYPSLDTIIVFFSWWVATISWIVVLLLLLLHRTCCCCGAGIISACCCFCCCDTGGGDMPHVDDQCGESFFNRISIGVLGNHPPSHFVDNIINNHGPWDISRYISPPKDFSFVFISLRGRHLWANRHASLLPRPAHAQHLVTQSITAWKAPLFDVRFTIACRSVIRKEPTKSATTQSQRPR
jgi:hypothetical protein